MCVVLTAVQLQHQVLAFAGLDTVISVPTPPPHAGTLTSGPPPEAPTLLCAECIRALLHGGVSWGVFYRTGSFSVMLPCAGRKCYFTVTLLSPIFLGIQGIMAPSGSLNDNTTVQLKLFCGWEGEQHEIP